MIEVVSGAPTGEEIAAIAAALSLSHCHPEPLDTARDKLREAKSKDGRNNAPETAWSLAMHYPDLEIDDLRALARHGNVL